MKRLYKDQKNSIYRIADKTGISRQLLYKYANGDYLIEHMPYRMVCDIAYVEKIEVNKLYEEMMKWSRTR